MDGADDTRLPTGSSNNSSRSIVTEAMVGGQHRVDEPKTSRASSGDTGKQEQQRKTPFVRRRRRVLEPSDEPKKKLLQGPASLEIAR